MAEPHRSNVENIRVRARNFRTSLVNTIKWLYATTKLYYIKYFLEEKLQFYAPIIKPVMDETFKISPYWSLIFAHFYYSY